LRKILAQERAKGISSKPVAKEPERKPERKPEARPSQASAAINRKRAAPPPVSKGKPMVKMVFFKLT
jgi:hypothetical protein